MTCLPAASAAGVDPVQSTGARARQHAHILDTALASLTRDGYPRMSIEGLAARAGVNKTTLYRWWSGKAALVAQALTQHVDIEPLHNTGATRTDLLTWLGATAAAYASIHAEVTIPALIGDLAATDGAAEAFREAFLARQRAGCAELIRRGIARGDLPATTDVELVADAMTATVFYRPLLAGVPTTADLPRRLLDLLLGPHHATAHPWPPHEVHPTPAGPTAPHAGRRPQPRAPALPGPTA